MKLSEAIETYLATAGNITTDQSRQRVRAIARQLGCYCGDRALSSYTSEELTGFCLGHPGPDGKPRGKAPNTIELRMGLLRSFFDWCVWQKLVSRSPAATLRYTVRVRGGGVREHTWLTEPEVLDIARSFDLDDPRQHRDYIVFRVTVMLGLRRSEVASLSWGSFRRGFGEVSLVGKGRKLATLPLPSPLRVDLERWHRAQPDGAVLIPKFRWVFNSNGEPHLVPVWDQPLGVSGIYDVVKQIAKAHDVGSLAPHDLRRSFAGIMESKGVGLKDLQSLMRHDQLSTTDKYLSDNPARLARVIENVQWGA